MNANTKTSYAELEHPSRVLLVANKCCSRCLYSDARLVSARSASRIQQDAAGSAHFICHRATYHTDPAGDIVSLRENPINAVCRAFFREHEGQAHFRLATYIQRSERTQMMYFVDLDTGALKPFGPGCGPQEEGDV